MAVDPVDIKDEVPSSETAYRRKPPLSEPENTPKPAPPTDSLPSSKTENPTSEVPSTGFWLTRIVFLRCLAFIYFIAFVVSLNQNTALIGQNGILPIPAYMARLRAHYGLSGRETSWRGFLDAPTVFWFIPDHRTDLALSLVSSAGIVISLGVLLQGSANAVMMGTLWVLYHSIVTVGQAWFSFGWESQLLETGFLAIWMVPLFSIQLLPINTPTSRVCVWGYRWLLFRIMLGAGLIKLRGDPCWRDLTCMNYHYETQPVPNPLSWALHHTPADWHAAETLGNHIVELGCPWLLLIPHRKAQALAGAVQIVFQSAIILSGNFAFLNWLTILPAILCFDDGYMRRLFGRQTLRVAVLAGKMSRKGEKKPRRVQRAVFNGVIGALIALLSIPVVQNMLSPRQVMNTSFDSFRLVNTYGAFGSITRHRNEVILEGTTDANVTPRTVWQEYEFKCKPGSLTRNPCLITPYHYRLDWLMWFAAFQQYNKNPWFVSLVAKLLEGDAGTRGLIARDPFANSTLKPTFIRAQHYRYQYTGLLAETNAYWTRRYMKPYMRAVSLEQLKSWREERGLLTKGALTAEQEKERARVNKIRTRMWGVDPEHSQYLVGGLLLVLFLLFLKLFRREMDVYYESSVGDIRAQIEKEKDIKPDVIGVDNEQVIIPDNVGCSSNSSEHLKDE